MNKSIVIGGSIVIALLAIGVFVLNSGDPQAEERREQAEKAHFVDLSTGKLFIADRPVNLQYSPGPGGGESALAIVMSCGDCGAESFIAYAERYRKDVIEALGAGPTPAPPTVIEAGFTMNNLKEVAVAEGEPGSWEWFEEASADGKAVKQAGDKKCGSQAKRCFVGTASIEKDMQ